MMAKSSTLPNSHTSFDDYEQRNEAVLLELSSVDSSVCLVPSGRVSKPSEQGGEVVGGAPASIGARGRRRARKPPLVDTKVRCCTRNNNDGFKFASLPDRSSRRK